METKERGWTFPPPLSFSHFLSFFFLLTSNLFSLWPWACLTLPLTNTNCNICDVRFYVYYIITRPEGAVPSHHWKYLLILIHFLHVFLILSPQNFNFNHVLRLKSETSQHLSFILWVSTVNLTANTTNKTRTWNTNFTSR